MSITEQIRAKKLNKLEARAVELRYEGKTYGQVTEALINEFNQSIAESSVRRWFSLGESLHDPYIEYAQAQNESRRKLVIEEVKKLMPIIPQRLNEILHRKKRDMFGKLIHDEDKKTMIQLDTLTIDAIEQLRAILGLDAPKKIDLASDQPVQQINIFQLISILKAENNLTFEPEQHEQHDAPGDISTT